MVEFVATRVHRRRIPSQPAWAGIAWSAATRPREGAPRWAIAAAGCALAGILSVAAWASRPGEPRPSEDVPVWIEEPPPSVPAPEDPVAPVPEHPTPAVSVAPLLASTPDVTPTTDPVFGMDDAVATGGLVVASGTTLAATSEPDPPPVPQLTSSGPIAVSSVPASVMPVLPVYPPRAEARGIESRVVALVTTDTTGDVVSVRIETSGGRDFDEAVRKAVLATRYQVPRREGRAQAVAFRMPYDFRLE